jgi:hypothetical protein
MYTTVYIWLDQFLEGKNSGYDSKQKKIKESPIRMNGSYEDQGHNESNIVYRDATYSWCNIDVPVLIYFSQRIDPVTLSAYKIRTNRHFLLHPITRLFVLNTMSTITICHYNNITITICLIGGYI